MLSENSAFERPAKRTCHTASSGAKVATARCASNIAVIKYWGKRDSRLILPINSSLSVTLDPNQMGTTTTAAISPNWDGDKIWLNGKEEDVNSQRIQNCLKEIRSLAGASAPVGGLRIVSENNFPTAAGLASSASGYACLVAALGNLYGIEGDLSVIARQGSGSACRSMYGGYVKWEMGTQDDGSDSKAVVAASENHWPTMHALIMVVSDEKKKVSSTGGMENSVRTSKLLQYRADVVVPDRMKAMERAIDSKNFEKFARLTMEESNQFHATCLDTMPPIFYMNDTSRAIVQAVHDFNLSCGRLVCAYTFDAGPNAVIFCEESNVVKVAKHMASCFPPKENTPMEDFIADADLREKIGAVTSTDDSMRGKVKYIIHTKVGQGPLSLSLDESLIDLETGLPKTGSNGST